MKGENKNIKKVNLSSFLECQIRENFGDWPGRQLLLAKGELGIKGMKKARSSFKPEHKNSWDAH